ncbi:MAG: response regulator [Gomphosphaeria aponina SAG 52.96 = DSM 107014]|uniref:histidine kinase n=1 Tax=Gomphosphaeria aponina SAG 52.96 = DSM 107014 TaxID=1521640 RepID=A0A941GWJ3_9CHRO|nr:response regulator [Gomphosphaeria aponina SAG 52.96 = DSM 107014]
MTTKILIVEDELLIAKSLARKLKKMDYTVVGIVSSGAAAIERASETQPDIILMDIVIKGEIDGITTAAKIREKYNIPVIYITAYADDETLERAEKTGSYGYILKPFKERELHAIIKIALNKHQELAKTVAASKEKSRYLSIAAHDLRNPLTTILGSSELLRDYSEKLSPEKKKQYFDHIKDAATNMNESLEELLLISKAEEGKLVFAPEVLDIVEFFGNVVKPFQTTLGVEHSLLFLCQHQSYEAVVDKNILHHILINLLSNAIKYSPNGGKIMLELICEEEQIYFTVQDEGIGMPQEYLASKLFKVFERANNVGSIKGTGLGLSIVKQEVILHNGNLVVESQEGVGTTVTVTIPCKKVEA